MQQFKEIKQAMLCLQHHIQIKFIQSISNNIRCVLMIKLLKQFQDMLIIAIDSYSNPFFLYSTCFAHNNIEYNLKLFQIRQSNLIKKI